MKLSSKIAKIASAVLALTLLLSLTGCQMVARFIGDVLREVMPMQTKAPDIEPTPYPQPTERVVDEACENALKELDAKMFAESVSGDALSFHLTVAHPQNFAGITDYPTGWGDFSYAKAIEETEAEKAWLDELRAIDRDKLSDDSRITYDTLEQYLEMSIASMDYYYYNEVLDTLVGLHSNLPLNLVFYDMHNKADVENYLALLADTPRYVGQILTFEQEKSADGKFMRDEALDKVLEQLKAFIDSRETCFLFATFDEFIADIDELTDGERKEYSKKNEALVNALIDSYQVLYDGLDALRGTATVSGPLCEYGDEGKEFFAEELMYNACSNITPSEALDILYAELDAQVNRLYDAAKDDPTIFDSFDSIDLTVGTTEDNIEYLKELMADYYPALPEHTLTFMDCPSELEDQFSPAAYLIPPVDDPSENLIILNVKTLGEDTRYLDTLAHEGYPGHLYHYQYLRTLVDKTGYMRQALSMGGYYESWSQSGEVFFDNHNDKFGAAYCNMMSANSMIGNLLLPAIASIEINYFGKTADDTAKLVAQYFGDEAAEELTNVYYRYAIENPFYFLEYALGFSIYQQELRAAQETCEGNFDYRSFVETYLNLGPTYFNISMPIMDEWINEHR